MAKWQVALVFGTMSVVLMGVFSLLWDKLITPRVNMKTIAPWSSVPFAAGFVVTISIAVRLGWMPPASLIGATGGAIVGVLVGWKMRRARAGNPGPRS